MDILDLPDPCLREVLITVGIRDRLNLRLTCRAFEKLVAETTAGFFETGCIMLRNNCVLIMIGDVYFDTKSVNELELLNLRLRLFRKISLGKLELDNDDTSIDFVSKFIEHFMAEKISFFVNSETELDNSLTIMECFPESRVAMTFWCLPEASRFLGLHRVEELMIAESQVSTDLFLQLLPIHNNINCGNQSVMISAEEWMKAMQVISGDTREREVRLVMPISLVIAHIQDFGFSETTAKAGDCCGEIEIIKFRLDLTSADRILLEFGYRRCWIRVVGPRIMNSDVSVTMSNRKKLL